MKRAIILLSLLMLGGCTSGQGISLAPYADQSYTPQNFRLCHGFGCTYTTPVSLTDGHWAQVRRIFSPSAPTAEAERQNIARAVAAMEREVVKASGITPDRAEAQSFESDQSQMDCLDETINTSLYLRFFEEAGFLKFHHVADPVHRGYLVDGQWPHNSGAVREIASGAVYAVDSYYEDNGGPVHVVPLEVWLKEWRPE